MSNRFKMVEIKFPVTLTDGINPDGRKRQDILMELSTNDPKDNFVQYHRAELRSNGHQIIEIMVNDLKVGELDDNDYFTYEESIHNAKALRLAIYQEEDENGNIISTCDTFMTIPYIASVEEKKNMVKKKKIIVLLVVAFLLAFGIKELIEGTFKGLLVALICSIPLIYLAFIRDPKKDDAAYQFLTTGKKKKSI